MGGASSFKNRVENHSQGITDLPGVDAFDDLTPFQNQVLDAAQRKEAEEKRKQQPDVGGGGSNQTLNSRGPAASSGMNREETVRYVNKEENPDYFDE
jgi:hypothetical protein